MDLVIGGQRHEQNANNNSLLRPSGRNIFAPTNRAAVNLFSEHKIVLDKTINFVTFSPFEKSFDILACATGDRIYVFRIFLLSENDDLNEELKFDYKLLHDYIIGSKATSVTFSPKTDFSLPQNNLLNFAIAGDDFGILIVNHFFSDDDTAQADSENDFFSGHTDYINDMTFDPNTNNYLASTSDDCTCCVWSLGNDKQKVTPEIKFQLSSPGMNVKWHTSEFNKLFVSEKKGLIRFYDTKTQVAVMSFECNRYPLMSSDWCKDDNLLIGCIAGKEIFFWETSTSSLPFKVIKTGFEGLSEFEFYDSKLIAFRGRPNNCLQVMNFENNQVYIKKEFVAGRGISWNRKQPLLAVGGSNGIYIYKINTF